MTRIALHSVAHTVSHATNPRNFRDVEGVSRYIPHPPKDRPCRTYLATPPSLCRGESSLQKRIALHGGVAATLTPIALHCATKPEKCPSRWTKLPEITWKGPISLHRQGWGFAHPKTSRCSREFYEPNPCREASAFEKVCSDTAKNDCPPI